MPPVYSHPGAGAGGTAPRPTAAGRGAKEVSGSKIPNLAPKPKPSSFLLPTPFQLTQDPSHSLFSEAPSSAPAPLWGSSWQQTRHAALPPLPYPVPGLQLPRPSLLLCHTIPGDISQPHVGLYRARGLTKGGDPEKYLPPALGVGIACAHCELSGDFWMSHKQRTQNWMRCRNLPSLHELMTGDSSSSRPRLEHNT